MTKHQNNGDCAHCDQIMDRYPNFNAELRTWFKAFQKSHPEAHCSCAGRGEMDQEAAFIRKTSRAHWKQSSHNYNCALDLFEMSAGYPGDIYAREWFDKVLAPEVPEWIDWYGKPHAPFPELPHIEVKEWRQLLADGRLTLV